MDIGIVDLIQLIRQLLVSSLSADAQTREAIELIRASVEEADDAAIIQIARETASRTDDQVNAFIARLEAPQSLEGDSGDARDDTVDPPNPHGGSKGGGGIGNPR